MITLTQTISNAAQSVGIQACAKALGVSNVSDSEAATHVNNYLKTTLRNLYLKGEEMKRQEAAESTAIANADAHIGGSPTVT